MGRPSVTSTASIRYQYHAPLENGGGAPLLWKGPRKVACFCLLAVFLPCVLVSVALLMRFVVNGTAIYHLAPSDMRILDHRISTIWCQSEIVKGNTSFTAFVTNGEPEVVKSSEPLVIERNLIIPDDHKEYWGFYLLKGSTFRIYNCARFKGGTLLIVRGRSHLEHCAYIGESDSAGDSDDFSSSTSRETKPTNQNDVNALASSKEEMGILLTKIRNYIRSRPKNYGKLKQSLADWMLLDQNPNMNNNSSLEFPSKTSAHQLEELLKSVTNESNGDQKSQELLQLQQKSKELLQLQQKSQEIEGDVVVEHGTIHRHRRQAELRKISESGENGAFEEEDENLNVKDSATVNKTVSGEHLSLEGGIWEREHNHHTGVLNDTVDPNDGSDSESESSWSSSEEAMAKCEGVVASFLITPNETCGLKLDDGLNGWQTGPFYEDHVNISAYYYFIFGSENEKRDNIIRARFALEKSVYDLPSPVVNCTGVRECKVDLKFGSSEKLVITVPQPPPEAESVWNENYVAESECVPRTSIYLLFVLTVPLIILLCAFQ